MVRVSVSAKWLRLKRVKSGGAAKCRRRRRSIRTRTSWLLTERARRIEVCVRGIEDKRTEAQRIRACT